ncbi:MAG TPA: hypothetical protein VGE34_02955 [Candidatus Saccharimonadales bacterium]
MEPASTNIQVNAKKSKKRIVIIVAAAIAILLVAVGITMMLIFADAEKKAKAAAEKYDKELTEYVEQLSKSKTIDATKSKLSAAPKLEEVNFGERTKEYNVAKSQMTIQQTYRDRLTAMFDDYGNVDFDKNFRKLDKITSDLVYKESDAEQKEENKQSDKSSKIYKELLELKFAGMPESDQSYIDKKAEGIKVDAEAAAQPLIAKYTVRLQAIREYKKQLEKLSANAFALQYKQGMLRGVSGQVSTLEKLIDELKKAKTAGEARRLEYRYDHIYDDAEQEYHNARWASEEVFYGSPSTYMTYVVGAMKYAAHEVTIPANQDEAKLYGDVLYYGHQASTTIPKEEKYYSRTVEAKIRFGLDELQAKIEKSSASKETKDKYLQLVKKATDSLTLPGDYSYSDMSSVRKLDRFISFVNYQSNYIGVKRGSGVASSDATESTMRAEAKGMRDFYSMIKDTIPPKGENGKKERDTLVKQVDVCMNIRFTYNDKTIERSLAVAKTSGLEAYYSVSAKFEAETDKLASQYVACTKKVKPLYDNATKQAANYSAGREFAVKQLAEIR